MASFSTLKPYSLPFAPIKPAYPPQVAALCNIVKKRSDYQNLVLHYATPQFRQFGGVKRPRIQRDTVVRSEIVASTAGFSDDSSHALADSQCISRIRGVCFYLATATIAIPLFIAMAIIHPFVLLFDRYRRRAQHFIASLWARFTIWPFYKFEIEGLENLPPNTTPSVYVSNHQSFLDIYTLLTLGRCFKFISKTSIFVYPIIGWAMFLMGVISLRRMDHRSQLDCLKRCIDLVRKGASVFFFPEGTRSKDGKLGAFKKGAFSVAAKTGVPIVPMTLLGTGKLMPAGKEGIINSGSVKVIIHKPIEGNDAEALCNEARSIIAESLLTHGYGVH
ncbi:1-acyl-sn-glycerol-3-phosphate acyltransferase 1 [Carex littledalei]|uniref:1-acyl-sn-glycerol-3-phosphate acyltransferase n=1 Tax=Carex littledalei TaxID=544730 RepID=A0A833QH17_9POAL|nr:1-acyl-sn-glycerol-3-phosphate acyltransferase 1 [Carex littledalei]